MGPYIRVMFSDNNSYIITIDVLFKIYDSNYFRAVPLITIILGIKMSILLRWRHLKNVKNEVDNT